jgi:hypothetical protein
LREIFRKNEFFPQGRHASLHAQKGDPLTAGDFGFRDFVFPANRPNSRSSGVNKPHHQWGRHEI